MKYLIALSFFVGSLHANLSSTVSDTMTEIMQTITTNAYYPLDLQKATIKAAEAISREVDDYTRFLDPAAYQELIASTAGHYYGIGIELGPKKADEDFLMILGVQAGSPAEKVGIKRYDKILGIDGTPIGSESIDENIKKLRGSKQFEPVTLTIARDKKILTLMPQRDRMEAHSSYCAYLPNQRIIYCHIAAFTHNVASEIATSLKKAPSATQGIILDLRDNPGGALQAAVDCASLFVPQGTPIVSIKNKHHKTVHTYCTTTKPLAPKLPIVILVNQYTASSAEILARSLQYYAEAGTLSPFVVVAGTRTTGKGSIQDIKPIGSDCALKLTTGIYVMPDNQPIEKRGVNPDIPLKQRYPAPDELKKLHKLYSPHKKTAKLHDTPKDRDARRRNALKKDYQVESALHILGLIHLAPKSITNHKKVLSWLTQHYAIPKNILVTPL